jgi:NAD(P)-dependent dehydrogenase (short-subunit alcohol dehydrogenase family)
MSREYSISLSSCFLISVLQQVRSSRVINVGSIDGIVVSKFENYSYSASKAAVHMLTRHLAKELAPLITVNAIAPGVFKSRMSRGILETHGDRFIAEIPMHRIGQASDIVGSIIYLSSVAGSYLTGAVIAVDGGFSSIG